MLDPRSDLDHQLDDQLEDTVRSGPEATFSLGH